MDDLPHTQAGDKVSVRLFERLLAACGWADLPLNLELWEGSRIVLGDAPGVTARLCSRTAVLDLLRPDLERLSDAYVEGRIEVDGPFREAVRAVIELVARRDGSTVLPARARARVSARHASENLRDLPAAFFEHVLGPHLACSCARFRHPDATLERSQSDGFEQVCRTLGLRPGMRLLDVDCGWGAFAIHAARRFDVSVVGLAVSSERQRHANARIAHMRLGDRVDIRSPGSRPPSPGERFDRVVSIDLLERSGSSHLSERLARIEGALAPGGMALLRTVTVASLDGRGTDDTVRDRPARISLADAEWERVAAAAGAGLALVELESLRHHHAQTLRRWSDRFEARQRRLSALAGERRMRYWRARLAGSALAFELGWLDGYQSIVTKPAARAAPPDRAALSRRTGRVGPRH